MLYLLIATIILCILISVIAIIFFVKYLKNNKPQKRNFQQECDEAIANWKKGIEEKKDNPPKENTNNDKKENKFKEYILKQSLMTQCEKGYYTAIKSVIPSGFFLQPQINLASIIEKNSTEYYANELFRNIDFCIFDQEYTPKLLIEINDSTHETEKYRQARDIKVKQICQSAGIPLITFWTKYGINKEYIKKRIEESLKQ